MVDTPSNTPQGGPDYKQWDVLREYLTGMGRMFTGQSGAVGSLGGFLKGVAVGPGGGAMLGNTEVVQAIRDLTNAIREASSKSGSSGISEAGRQKGSGSVHGDGVPDDRVGVVLGKIFEKDRQGNFQFDRTKKGYADVPESEGGLSVDDINLLESSGAMAMMHDRMRNRLKKKRKEDSSRQENSTPEVVNDEVESPPTVINGYNDSDDTSQPANESKPTLKDTFFGAGMKDVTSDEEWVDANQFRFGFGSDGKTPWSMMAATSGTDLGGDAANSFTVYRDEMRRLHSTLVSILEGMVTDLRYDNARLEEIERYFRQTRETL